MMQGRLSRLRRMTIDEGRWRASELARTVGDRARARLTTPRWHREDIGRVLAADVLDAAMRDALARQDWAAVDGLLADRLARRQARCVIDPSLAESMRHEVSSRWPDADDWPRAKPLPGACSRHRQTRIDLSRSCP